MIPKFRSGKPAITIRYEEMPFNVDFSKEDITSIIKANKAADYGVTNTLVYFNSGRSKATVIHLDAFSQEIRKRLLESK